MAKASKSGKKVAAKKAKAPPPEPAMEGAAGSPRGSVNRSASKKNPKAAKNAEQPKNEPPPGRSPVEIATANAAEITEEQKKTTMTPKRF